MTTEARERLRDAWVSDAEITRATTHDDVHADGPAATNRLLYAVRQVNLPAVLDVVEAAQEWRATWCAPLSGPALSAASRKPAGRATDALKAALDALADQPNGADAPTEQEADSSISAHDYCEICGMDHPETCTHEDESDG